MISPRVFIAASAFTLAIAGALVTDAKEEAITSYNGYTYDGRCLISGPPFEPQCSINYAGSYCSVYVEAGDDSTWSPAYLSLSYLPTCLLALRQPQF